MIPDSIGSDRNIHQIRDHNRRDLRTNAAERAIFHIDSELRYLDGIVSTLHEAGEAKAVHGALLTLEKRIAALTDRAAKLMELLP